MSLFDTPTYVDTNGIKMAIYEQGENEAGVPVILCHGFPELAYSWRKQLPALAQAGFHTIAPDQRGYGNTGGPTDEASVPLYDVEHLIADLLGMLDAKGIKKAVFVGHDWGGLIVWQLAQRHPDRVAGVIGVNTPFMARLPMDPIALMRQFRGDDMYIVYFQKFGVADALFNKDPARTMRFWFRKSPMTLADFDALPEDQKNFELVKGFNTPEADWQGTSLLNAEDEAYYANAFAKTGFTGPINWYRNWTRNWERSEDVPEHVAAPCLMICAANDVVLRPEHAEGMEQYCPDLETHIIPDCGHWTQSEQPEALNALMIDWLQRRFPAK